MRIIRLAVLIAACGLAGVACGKKSHRSTGHGVASMPIPAPPTPDTTPVAALRTPAGWLLLKPETPASTPTPAAMPASAKAAS